MYTIDDFLTLETRIEGQRDAIEASPLGGVQDYFEHHLAAAFSDPNELAQYGIGRYQVKIGTVIEVQPTEWALAFSREKNIPLGDYYGRSFEVVDVSIEYLTKNPNQEPALPLVAIKLTLREATN
jgi:hypothetical protein